MGRLMVTASGLALLGLCAGATVAMISAAPAFNAQERRDNVFDQTVVMLGSQMYDPARYLMQQAVSYIRADLLSSEAAPIEVVMERGETAIALMEESLAQGPGNAQGWVVMAWAQLYAGSAEEATDALRHSWALAPHNYGLARERMDLALVLFAPLPEIEPTLPGDIPALTPEDRAAILRDMETIRLKYRAEDYDLLAEDLEAAGFELELPPRNGQGQP